MPEITVEGCKLSFTIDGPEHATPLLLSNSIGSTSDLWAFQREPFSRVFRVIRYDTRGHGRSDAPPGEYSLERLGHDALAILDAAAAPRAHVCGLSLGGLTAMWLAIHAPDRIGRLVAANTAARIGTVESWQERIQTIRSSGLQAIAEVTMARWFSEPFRRRHPATIEKFRSMLLGCSVDGYAGCCAAIRDADLRDELSRIDAPTLAISGTHDVATPPAAAEFIRNSVGGARMVVLDAAHLSNVEQAEAFTSAVMDFLR